jgi:hypothetical protein
MRATDAPLPFTPPNICEKEVTAAFEGGTVSSDGGVFGGRCLQASWPDRHPGRADPDRRDLAPITHSMADIPRGRTFAIARGYLDGNGLDDLHKGKTKRIRAPAASAMWRCSAWGAWRLPPYSDTGNMIKIDSDAPVGVHEYVGIKEQDVHLRGPDQVLGQIEAFDEDGACRFRKHLGRRVVLWRRLKQTGFRRPEVLGLRHAQFRMMSDSASKRSDP